ncbi:ubiquinone biosynthesis methyltransferase [Puccinia graminis f. sp. tritici CRL 75-36-700-3]|uniref:2-methoxy-6-polyprenyl-1,4-benzoquinol methylase, mitochondrial n=1 Tax=Puccinia graminis f. sp. tritici (strain CRL 75-36-700-3 / race SCCL) TaxID=418459 RepID=E3KCI9_PUCGT|nr:ubiquinone biosynthesis methyltransferase [Puccinia graminis f. sp. tritici CRL 75-36-700-3]EFP81937.1 ubiquinone biosynthesis methyltransferase [Puccinia graminis f. sp. tritici CRL 75-36-700-3]
MNRFIITPLSRARQPILLPSFLSRTHSTTTVAADQKPKPTPIQFDEHPDQPKTHFGYRDVPEQAKQSLVGQVFSSVASSYDVMNDAMSLGIHRMWKDHYVKSLDPHGDIHCLDVAGGTADIGLRILDHARLVHSDRQTKVTILDINPDMLAEGQKKVNRSMYYGGDQIEFKLGNAQDLRASSIEDNSVDLYTIAFGIRNCTHIDAVLKEAYRVLKKGGRFSCLEFGKVNNPLLAGIYEMYSFNVIPNLGHILASDRDSYQYLVESIRRFPAQPKFAEMIQEAGFVLPGAHKHLSKDRNQGWEDLTFGVASIHNGIKL